jgi:hypothetical protein
MELVLIIAESLILICAVVVGILALKMHDLVKGGQLVSSWRWLIGAAVFFCVMEILEITNKMGYVEFANLDFAITLLKALLALFLMLGFLSYKRSID